MIRLAAREVKSKKYQGVYYRPLENGDRSYFLRIRLDGKVKRIPIGKKSEGITEAFCNQEKHRLINSHRFGEDAAAQLQKVKRDDPTFAELTDYYLVHSGIRESTVKVYRCIKKVPFAESRRVKREDIQLYIDEHARKFRPATVHSRYRQIKTIYKFAIDRGLYRYENPCEGISLPKGKTARQRYFSADEIGQILDALRDKPRLYLFVKISVCTGARIGTVINVHADDVKPDGSVRLYNFKTNHWYTGFLDEETMDMIKGRDGYLIARRGKQDQPPGYQAIYRPVQKVIDELFNDEKTPREQKAVVHTLRHAVATRMIEKGIPMEVVAKTLDHSSPVITAQVYAKVSPELVRGSVAGLWD